MEVVFVHVINGNLSFNRKYYFSQRKTLLSHLRKAHNMTQFKSKLVSVEQQHGGSVGVVVFDNKAIFEHIYNSPKIISPNNIAKGIDFWTGKVTHPSTCYGEIHDGEM